MIKKKIIPFLAFALFGNGPPIQEQNGILFFEGETRGKCFYNRLMPSSDGTGIVISQQNDRFQDARDFMEINDLVVVSGMHSINKDADQSKRRIHVLGSREKRLRPLFWSDDGIFLRSGATGLFKGSLKETWIFEPKNLDNAWQAIEITINSPDGVKALDNRANIRSAATLTANKRLRRQSAYLSSMAFYSAIDIKDKQRLLAGTNVSKLSDLGLSSFFYRFNMINSGDTISSTFLGGEKFAEAYAIGNIYSLPVIDYTSGNQVGLFQPDEIEMQETKFSDNEFFKNTGYLIKDVVYARGRVFALAENGLDHSLFVFDATSSNDPMRLKICQISTSISKHSLSNIDQHRKSQPLVGIRLSENADTTGVLFRTNAPQTLGVILYFHGGPGLSNDVYRVPHPLTRLWKQGYDILGLEYSGSVGGGLKLSNGLANKSNYGFAEDAEAITAWLSVQKYKKVHSYAVSFGTLPAMFFATNFDKLVGKRIFAAPLLEHPRARSLERADRFSEVESGAQLEFEKGLYGSSAKRLSYIKWISSMAKNYRASKKDLFIFGKYDSLTPLENAPRTVRSDANILLVPRDHAFITADTSTIDKIYEHITY